MLIAQSILPHISQLDRSFRAGIHEPIAAFWMKLGGRDDFSELFHIRWLDVDDVETLILDVEVPQIDAEVVTTYERLPIAIDGYAVYVVGMSVCIISARNSGDDGVVVSQPGQLEGRCVAK